MIYHFRDRERERERERERGKMEVSMSLNALVRLPLSNSRAREDFFFKTTFPSPRRSSIRTHRKVLVVEAKGKKGMAARQFQRAPPPPLPKLEDDGNPKFVIFIRTANVYLWYPLSVITGGTTAKIMVAAKDNFLGKYIYKDTIARNLAAVIYRDEKQIQRSAFKQFRVLRSATAFRYGYKLVENNNLRSALSTSDVIELPTQEELKTVLDKVVNFFGDAASGAKESFGKLTSLTSTTDEESEEKSEVKS
ncbi:multidrug resistance protein isoform X1 [Tasmannia lanceolata]|uniref:multidrug resistance protein isoform X1 n=1 Tax=Tasmannia lanceolata TaxID=3420 RepID=UPI004063211D